VVQQGSGYRIYGPEIVERLRFVRKAQAVRLALDEIKEILDLADQGTCPCGHVEVALIDKLRGVDALRLWPREPFDA